MTFTRASTATVLLVYIVAGLFCLCFSTLLALRWGACFVSSTSDSTVGTQCLVALAQLCTVVPPLVVGGYRLGLVHACLYIASLCLRGLCLRRGAARNSLHMGSGARHVELPSPPESARPSFEPPMTAVGPFGDGSRRSSASGTSSTIHRSPPSETSGPTFSWRLEHCFAGGGGGMAWAPADGGGGVFQKWASVPGPLFCVRTDVAAKGAGTQILDRKASSTENPVLVIAEGSRARGQ